MSAKTQPGGSQGLARRMATLGKRLDEALAELASLDAKLQELADGKDAMPRLPEPDKEGLYPARQTTWVLLAQEIITRRRAAGLTQVELARRAGIRHETISRLESGKHAPTVRTVDKIDAALRRARV